MANGQLTLALQHLRKLIRQRGAGELADTQLLERFVGQRDEAAFEVLVWRHGPMVLSLCQRLLHNPHDAEDVLQATFLTLVRKAASIGKRESLGSWLYKVAYRIALHAKAQAAKRAAGARPVEDVQAAEDEDVWGEVRPLLDEAIQRLPEKYRTPIVLCYLQGKTNREAAEQLGCPLGTVCTRLTRARGLLRRQLARHGVALSAALLGTMLSKHAVSAAASTTLVAATVKAGCLLAAGQTAAAGLISANVASLVKGASQAMFLTKLKITTVLLLAAGVLAAGAGVLTHRTLAARQADSRQPAAAKAPALALKAAAGKETPQVKPAPDDRKDVVAFAGRVLDPDGKPLAGAKLYVLYYTPKRLAVPARATSSKDGRFQFTLGKTDFDQSYSMEPWSSASVVAQADGYGLGFDVPRLGKKKPRPTTDLTLRVVKDDVPVAGRVLDLEGKPMAGVSVTVRGLLAPQKGNLKPWIEALKARKDGYPVQNDFLSGLTGGWIGHDLGRLYPPVTTGADGRFRLKNVGRERVVSIRVEGPTIETRDVQVMTRPGGTMRVPEYRNNPAGGTLTYYGATFDHVAAPTVPIVGVVRDKETSKPLAGAIIESYKFADSNISERAELRTFTDKDGSYRLTGMPKGDGNILRASPPEGQPYLMALKSVPAGRGLDSVTVDFRLKRGVWIEGKVTDKATGKPVRARVEYFVFEDNPHRREAPGLTTDSYLENRADDGTFRVVALPGRGMIGARAWGDHYMIGVGADRIKGLDKRIDHFQTYPHLCYAKGYHTLVEVSPEKAAALVTCPVVLDPGRTLAGKVLGPDGKPLAGARVSGLTSYGGHGYWEHETQKTAEFAATGLKPGEPRLLLFVHEGKHLAGFLVVKGDEKGPLAVKLHPWGVLSGRLVNADGQPQGGAELVALGGPIKPRPAPTGKLDELSVGSLPTRGLRTDKDGKFRLEGLIPGLKYNIGIMEEGYRITGTLPENLMVKPGEVKDLGNVKPDPTGA